MYETARPWTEAPAGVCPDATGRPATPADERRDTHHLFQVSAGYAFAFGVALNVRYAYATDASVADHAFGILLTDEFDFVVR